MPPDDLEENHVAFSIVRRQERTLRRIAVAGILALTLGFPLRATASDPTPSWVRQRIEQGHRCRRYEGLFRAYGLPLAATYLAWRESRCNPRATNGRFDKHGHLIWTRNANGTYDSGLLQINSGWKTLTTQACHAKAWDRELLFDVRCNLAVAKVLYDQYGLQPWSM